MTSSGRIRLRRYWREQGSTVSDRGVGAALATGRGDLAGIVSIAEAASHPCTVFLAPPGAGKSTEMKHLVNASGDGAQIVSLGSTESEERLIGKIKRAVGKIARRSDALLAVDSLDECTLGPRALAALVKEIVSDLLPDGVRFALACRTAAWLPSVGDALQESFHGDVTIFDLVPLTDADAACYARSAGLDDAAFLQALRRANAMALAANAKMLELLVNEYLDGDEELPGTQRDLFERSCRRLVTEQNRERRAPLESVDVPGLLDAAGQLAVFSLFTGRASFALDLSAEPVPGFLTAEACSEPRYADVLGTALFESAGEGHVRFMHQTVAEFLAARYLEGSGLSLRQVDALLRSRGGRLAPPVQAVAAWLIALAPFRFAALLDEDPVAFLQSSVELTDVAYRRSLVERLIELAQRYELPDIYGVGLDGLAYDGIDARLRAVLIEPSTTADAYYLAQRITLSNRLVSLGETLVEVALDVDRAPSIRASAGWTALELVEPAMAGRLTVLASPGPPPADDDGDDLLGVGLRALLRGGLSPVAVLPRLKEPNNPHFFGGYRSLTELELPRQFESLTLLAGEVHDALAWVADQEAGEAAVARTMARLSDAVLFAGLRQLSDIAVRTEVGRLIGIRLAHWDRVFREQAPVLPDVADLDRHELLLDLQRQLADPYMASGLREAGLVGVGDFDWLLDRAATAATDEQAQRWLPWLILIYDPTKPDHRSALAGVPQEAPLYQHAQLLLQPPAPWPRRRVHQPPEATEEGIKVKLGESLALGTAEAFPALSSAVEFKPGSRGEQYSLNLRITALPGWALLTDEQRTDAVSAAQSYLATTNDNGEDLLGKNLCRPRVLAVARAFVLLAEYGIAPNLDENRWRFLAPAVIQNVDGTPDPFVDQALRWVYEESPDAMLAAAEKEIQSGEVHARIVLRAIGRVLTPTAVPWLVRLVNDRVAEPGVAFAQLLGLDEQTALALVHTAVADRTDQLRTFATIVITRTQSAGWKLVHESLTSDPGLGTDVISELADDHGFHAANLNEPEVVELWQLTNRLFPRSEDPVIQGGHGVSRREMIGQFRDRLLLALAERGTRSAVECLGRITESHPNEPWLRRLTVQARAALGRADWSPLHPAEVKEILSSTHWLMRSDIDLLHAVRDALNQTQQRVHGVPALATLLWNHGKQRCAPKSEDEISDYINSEIERSLSRIVVNREVQVTRLQPSGLGQRTDLLVQALGPANTDRILRVAIEVKGNWNDEIKDGLENQLVKRYVIKWSAAAGIFLVAWFDPKHGAKPGTWRRDPIRGDREALTANLNDRAARATENSGHEIQAFILDCSMVDEDLDESDSL